MIDTWRNQIIMNLQAEGDLSLEAAARVDLMDPEESGSPLIECVVEGELDGDILAKVIQRVTSLARLDWTMVPYAVIRDEFEMHRDLCQRFRVVPLRVVSKSHVDVAMVDPSWGVAHRSIKELYGLPMRTYVISYSDFIFITRPELAPALPVVEDEVDTMISSPPLEVMELMRAFDERIQQKSLAYSTPHNTLDLEPGMSVRPARSGVRVEQIFAPDRGGRRVELSLFDGEDELLDEGVARRLATTGDVSSVRVEVRGDDASFSHKLPDTNPNIRARETGPVPEFEPLAQSVSEKRVVDSATANANAVIGMLVHQALTAEHRAPPWDDIFDITSLIARGALRAIVENGTNQVLQNTLDGSPMGKTTLEEVAEMITRTLAGSMSRTTGPMSFHLVPSTRPQRALVSYFGETTLFVADRLPDERICVFGVVGFVPEHREVVRRLLTFLSERTLYLRSMGDPPIPR